jgi:tetratricopeptide (TPR) repeat protein
MAVRFCSRCGTKAVSGGAKFCAECGADLAGPRSAASGWQLTIAGSAVLVVFLAAGLAVWTVILSPAARPGLAAPAGRPSASSAPGAAADATSRVALPDQAKAFIADLTAQAKQKPDDVDTWTKLAQVSARAAQLDPAYQTDAINAYDHVLALDPKNADALRGVANLHYDRDDHQKAIPAFEKYLALRPDDPSAKTDLGTMYLYSGQPERAVATYQDVIKNNPAFLQAHYNLAVTYHGQGKDQDALKELEVARGLATDDPVRKQIDDMIASLKGGRPAPAEPVAKTVGAGSPFQTAVEEAFRAHPIMGPRIVRFEWGAPASGRVLVRNFPMAGMPPEVREKFTGRLAEQLRTAEAAHPVDGPVRVEIADATDGSVMATVTP